MIQKETWKPYFPDKYALQSSRDRECVHIYIYIYLFFLNTGLDEYVCRLRET